VLTPRSDVVVLKVGADGRKRARGRSDHGSVLADFTGHRELKTAGATDQVVGRSRDGLAF